jgi:hypothetical protein
MGSDGNLIEDTTIGPSIIVWSSGTYGFPGARLVLRDDGNLIIVDANGYQRWATNTAWYTPPAIVSAGQKLTTGQQLLSAPDAMTRLILQSDGNVVLYSIITGKPLGPPTLRASR